MRVDLPYSDDVLVEKLHTLTIGEQDIKGIGRWLVSNPQHARSIVTTWAAELRKVDGDQKIALIYLCNEIMLTSKNKTATFVVEFMEVLIDALTYCKASLTTTQIGDGDAQKVLQRLVQIWDTRKLFSPQYTKKLHDALRDPPPATKVLQAATKTAAPNESYDPKPQVQGVNDVLHAAVPPASPLAKAPSSLKDRLRVLEEKRKQKVPNNVDTAPSPPSPPPPPPPPCTTTAITSTATTTTTTTTTSAATLTLARPPTSSLSTNRVAPSTSTHQLMSFSAVLAAIPKSGAVNGRGLKRTAEEMEDAVPPFHLVMTAEQLDALVGLTKSALVRLLIEKETRPPLPLGPPPTAAKPPPPSALPATPVLQPPPPPLVTTATSITSLTSSTPSSTTAPKLIDRDSFEIAEMESNIMLLQDILKVRELGLPMPAKILKALPQLQRTFPQLVLPDEQVIPAVQLARSWRDFEYQCQVNCTRLEERLHHRRRQMAKTAAGIPSARSPQLVTPWGKAAPAHETELAKVACEPSQGTQRCVFLHLNSLRDFFCHFSDPIPPGTMLQVFYGGSVRVPDVPTTAPFLDHLGPSGVRFTKCDGNDAACALAFQAAVRQADQGHPKTVNFVLICSHDIYFSLMKGQGSALSERRPVRHVNPKSLPLPAVLAAVTSDTLATPN